MENQNDRTQETENFKKLPEAAATRIRRYVDLAVEADGTQGSLSVKLEIPRKWFSNQKIRCRATMGRLWAVLTPENLYRLWKNRKITLTTHDRLEDLAVVLGEELSGGRQIERLCVRREQAAELNEEALFRYARGDRALARRGLERGWHVFRESPLAADDPAYPRVIHGLGVLGELICQAGESNLAGHIVSRVEAMLEDYQPCTRSACEDVVAGLHYGAYVRRSAGHIADAESLGRTGRKLISDKGLSPLHQFPVDRGLSRCGAVQALRYPGPDRDELRELALRPLKEICGRARQPEIDDPLYGEYLMGLICRVEIRAAFELTTDRIWEEVEASPMPAPYGAGYQPDLSAKIPMGKLAYWVSRQDRDHVRQCAEAALAIGCLELYVERQERVRCILWLVKQPEVDWRTIRLLLFLQPGLLGMAEDPACGSWLISTTE